MSSSSKAIRRSPRFTRDKPVDNISDEAIKDSVVDEPEAVPIKALPIDTDVLLAELNSSIADVTTGDVSILRTIGERERANIMRCFAESTGISKIPKGKSLHRVFKSSVDPERIAIIEKLKARILSHPDDVAATATRYLLETVAPATKASATDKLKTTTAAFANKFKRATMHYNINISDDVWRSVSKIDSTLWAKTRAVNTNIFDEHRTAQIIEHAKYFPDILASLRDANPSEITDMFKTYGGNDSIAASHRLNMRFLIEGSKQRPVPTKETFKGYILATRALVSICYEGGMRSGDLLKTPTTNWMPVLDDNLHPKGLIIKYNDGKKMAKNASNMHQHVFIGPVINATTSALLCLAQFIVFFINMPDFSGDHPFIIIDSFGMRIWKDIMQKPDSLRRLSVATNGLQIKYAALYQLFVLKDGRSKHWGTAKQMHAFRSLCNVFLESKGVPLPERSAHLNHVSGSGGAAVTSSNYGSRITAKSNARTAKVIAGFDYNSNGTNENVSWHAPQLVSDDLVKGMVPGVDPATISPTTRYLIQLCVISMAIPNAAPKWFSKHHDGVVKSSSFEQLKAKLLDRTRSSRMASSKKTAAVIRVEHNRALVDEVAAERAKVKFVEDENAELKRRLLHYEELEFESNAPKRARQELIGDYIQTTTEIIDTLSSKLTSPEFTQMCYDAVYIGGDGKLSLVQICNESGRKFPISSRVFPRGPRIRAIFIIASLMKRGLWQEDTRAKNGNETNLFGYITSSAAKEMVAQVSISSFKKWKQQDDALASPATTPVTSTNTQP